MMWWMFPALFDWRIRTATPSYESRRGTPCAAGDPARATMLKITPNARLMSGLAIFDFREETGV
jgi:hypothetical protein